MQKSNVSHFIFLSENPLLQSFGNEVCIFMQKTYYLETHSIYFLMYIFLADFQILRCAVD